MNSNTLLSIEQNVSFLSFLEYLFFLNSILIEYVEKIYLLNSKVSINCFPAHVFREVKLTQKQL